MTFFTRLIPLFILFVAVFSSCSTDQKISGVVFPNTEYSKVVAYDYEGLKGENIYDFKNQKLYHTIKNEQELSGEQISNLLDVLNDEKSYGGDVTRCFKPRLGVVFYDAQGKAKAEISICFECNQHQSTPTILAQESAKAASAMSFHGYSNEGRQKLVDFCKSLNFTNCGTVEHEDEHTEASTIH
jgi:hypothetical protein